MGGVGTTFAGNIAVEQLSTPYGQCNPAESKDINYYLQEQFSQKPADAFYNTHSYGTLPRRTSNAVQLWSNGVIAGCQDWGLESNFFPASNSSNKYVIFQNHDACVFYKPSYTKENDPDRLDAQIHYKIAYSYVMPNGDKSATLPWYYRKNGENVYRCAQNNQITNQTSTCPQFEKKYDSKIYDHLGECLNYRVFWCGDGLLNGQQGNTHYENGTFTEQCDPKDPNKTNWGN